MGKRKELAAVTVIVSPHHIFRADISAVTSTSWKEGMGSRLPLRDRFRNIVSVAAPTGHILIDVRASDKSECLTVQTFDLVLLIGGDCSG